MKNIFNIKNSVLYLIGLLTSTTGLIAQAPLLDWAFINNSATSYSSATTVGNDTLGNVYFTGRFLGTVDFDPGPGVSNLTSIGTTNSIYVQKLDINGNFVWVKHIGTAGPSSPTISKAHVSNNGTITMTGSYRNTVDFDPGPSIYNLTSGTSSFDDMFVWQLDNDGNVAYARSFGSSSPHSIFPSNITVDNSWGVCVSGNFENTIDFDPSSNVYNITPVAYGDAFIIKLDNYGDFVWAKSIGTSSGNTNIYTHTIDNLGNIISGGKFYSTTDFDPGPGTYTMNFTSGEGFIMEWDANGNFVWAKQYGSLFVKAIEVSNQGNIYCGGIYYNTANTDADPSPGATYSLTGGQGGDVYIQKLNSAGNFIWAESIGGIDDNNIGGLKIDNNENIIYSGSFRGNTDFDPGAGTSNFTSIPFNYGNIYLSSLNSAGQFRYAQTFEGVPDDYIGGSSISIDLDLENHIYLTGNISDSVDFNPNTSSTYYLTPATSGNTSSYIIKLFRCVNSSSSIIANGCRQYISPSGNYTWTSSGIYNDTIANTTGCDSIININLTITNIDTNVTISNGVFTVGQAGGTYQWFDCIGSTSIPGATSQSYLPSINGSYGVLVNYNGCTDTTSCYNIIDVGLDENNLNTLNLYPNPAQDHLKITYSQTIIMCKVYDITGKLMLHNENVMLANEILNISELKSGNYILEVYTNDGTIKRLFIKQ